VKLPNYKQNIPISYRQSWLLQ